MASLWKHPQSKYFTACWTDLKGRRLKRSTKETDRKKAEKIARRFEEESRIKRTEKQARRVLTEIFRDISGVNVEMVTVRKFFTDFIGLKKLEVSPATLAYYTGHSKRFLAWLGPRADDDIASITKHQISSYRTHIAATAGPTAVNNSLKAIKAFFAAALAEELLADDPAADVAGVRDRSQSARRPFTLEELRAVRAVADPEWQSLISFGFYLGARLGDVAMLKWENFDLARNEVRFTTRKTGREQTLPLAPALLAHIATLKSTHAEKSPLHPKAAAVVQRTGRTGILSKQFAHLLTKAELRPAETAPEAGFARARHRLSYHSLRHTATSLLKNAGIPRSVVMAFVGHEDPATSDGYTHTGREALEKAAAAFPVL